ncbi:MAG: Mrp/NBP35 family ATP-binding protein [Candidatus Thermoplasmatota archaeon]|nr:Mrp/NBP35 family ATP-binding protein [Candidatus Thermoplasmatota archaeon]
MDELKKINERMNGIKHKVVVMSGKGGVGKSTIAANLAYALAKRGKRVCIFDADMHGPTIPKLFGVENEKMKSDENGIKPVFAKGVKIVSMDFLMDKDKPLIWRGPLKMNAIKQLFMETDWGELDYLIIDLPPGTGDEPLSIAQLLPSSDGAIIVSTPQNVALMSVRRSIGFAKSIGFDVLGLVINMAYVKCPNCGEKIDLFERGAIDGVLKDFGIELLATLPFDPEIDRLAEKGELFVSLENDISHEFDNVVKRVMK